MVDREESSPDDGNGDRQVSVPQPPTDNREEILLDTGWRAYNATFDVKKMIETKAQIVLSVDGVLLGLLADGFKNFDGKYATVVIITLLSSAFFAVASMAVKKYRFVKPKGILQLFNENQDASEQKLQKMFFGRLISIEEFNTRLNIISASFLEIAIFVFFIALLVLAFGLLMPFNSY